ncbi:MAG: lasso peptide biosynthesis B2 protein [Gammaproteobacteria bacterium]|nr:MAG: lasso peptide biosynthesis B2 protein [Gammaproteobacteria bacterium]RLA53996.1 MAG: lasso peptide biosynthesis B2 protein [Gammaproteobacteria bacterium]
MFNRVRQFAALDASQKLIFVQVWFLLGWIRVAILTVSFKRLTASLQHHREIVPPISVELEEREQAARIGILVASAAKYTPWQSLCLAQVLTVQRLLSRRNIPGQFYLGVCKNGEEGADPTGLAAHAWLQCGDVIVNGGAGHQEYTVVSTFSWGRL